MPILPAGTGTKRKTCKERKVGKAGKASQLHQWQAGSEACTKTCPTTICCRTEAGGKACAEAGSKISAEARNKTCTEAGREACTQTGSKICPQAEGTAGSSAEAKQTGSVKAAGCRTGTKNSNGEGSYGRDEKESAGTESGLLSTSSIPALRYTCLTFSTLAVKATSGGKSSRG